ncbi:hypothetical protein [Amycolatopsis sp. cmx-4-83]|uniref:hypothetical protein n=1 Tax=Amycolatopsis sp. cmx-4-83 TaxID=2790940 RepID=UPI00397D7B33
MRECGEEFSDVEEARGRGGRPIGYSRDEPFLLDGKPSLYTVCVLDSPTFDEIFAGMVSSGPEGTILVGPDRRGSASS